MDTTNLLGDMFHIGTNWNIILLIIAGCSIVSVTVFIERFLQLKRSESDTNRLIVDIRNAIKEGNVIEAVQVCENTGGTIANIIKSGIEKHNRPKDQIESAMELTGMVEIAQLEKNAKILSVIAYISPLIGLLGTVLGFIQAFAEMRTSGLVDISATRLGEAMEYALVTTAAGLVVAIPSVLAYNYIVSRIEGFILEIQTTSSEIVDLLIHKDEEFSYLS